MEILQLKYFCEAALCESFSMTARKFGVPPSDISQSIKRLEGELGAALFTRYANRIELNGRGRAFYEKVSEALGLLSDAAEAATVGYEETRLRLCVNCNRRIVMRAIELLRREVPGAKVEMDTFADPVLRDYDVIVAGEGAGYERYKRRLLMTERILLALPSGHRFADRDLIDPRELAGESFIAMSELSSLSEPAAAIYRAGGFEPTVALKTDDPFYFRQGVEMGLGIAVVPEISWRGQFSDGVRLVSCGDFMRRIYVYTDKTKYKSELTSRFVEILCGEVERENSRDTE